MARVWQVVLIAATLPGSWLGMQAVHELGHVIGAWLTGGSVENIVLHPLAISRTDLRENPHPLPVVWAGPIAGVLLPVLAWQIALWFKLRLQFIARFFAGFCLIANGAYIGLGSFERIGDCGDLLNSGAAMWQLWLFGAICIPSGLWLWNGTGSGFGLGRHAKAVQWQDAVVVLALAIVLLALGLWVGD